MLNFQNLKRLFILHRLGAKVENASIIEYIYNTIQPYTSVIIKSAKGEDFLCRMDKDGHVIYYRYYNLNTKLILGLSIKHAKLIYDKIRQIEGIIYTENTLRDIFQSCGIQCDFFYIEKVKVVTEYLQNKYDNNDFRKYENLGTLP